jgi:hypothetical protein
MALPGTISRYVKDSDNVTNAAFTETVLENVAPHGLVRRLRIAYRSGAVANVQFELRRRSGGTGFDVLFDGALAAGHDRGGPGDQIEVPFLAATLPRQGITDTNLYVALKSNNAGVTIYSVELYAEER